MTDHDLPPSVPAGPRPRVTPEGAHELFRSALRWVLLFLGALALVSVVVGALVAQGRGVWGALLGTAVAAVFSGTTVWSMWWTSHRSPSTMFAVVAGSWLVKIVVLFVAVAVLQGLDFFHPKVFVIVVIVGVLGSLVLDLVAFQRVRVPYVDPS